MDLLYDDQFQQIKFPFLQDLSTTSLVGMTDGREHAHVRLYNLLRFLQRHSSTLSSVTIRHVIQQCGWVLPSITRRCRMREEGTSSVPLSTANGDFAPEIWTQVPVATTQSNPALLLKFQKAVDEIRNAAIYEIEANVQLNAEVASQIRAKLSQDIDNMVEDQCYPISRHELMHRLRNEPKGLSCGEFFKYLRDECAIQKFGFSFDNSRHVYTNGLWEEIEYHERFYIPVWDGAVDQQDINAFEKYVGTWMDGVVFAED